jgi:polyisoprenoid-binding protein YceI
MAPMTARLGAACALAAALLIAPASAEQTYDVVAAETDVHWLIYRAGAFARFGHNHVISAAEIGGRATVDTNDLANSRFELEIPVAGLVVDDPMLRAGLGEEFASTPSADDIAGTRDNMLGEGVLQAEQHPSIRITGTGPISAAEGQAFDVTIELLGRSVTHRVPTAFALAGETLEARGEFRLTHADLGMKPFSVMGGALQVGENIDFVYRVHARRAADPER